MHRLSRKFQLIPREAIKALIVANTFLETDLEETEGGGLDGLRAREIV
ncbi:hypothetical protein [Afipia sp. GAS231]|nr:hypothetical protein [Afipia sp. GAS231]SDO34306.1 hypothetical protein SAMN05444050_3901 [Afipia sp. GAS231]